VDDDYREWVVKQTKDPIVRAFWQTEFAGYEKRFRNEVVAPVQNKVGQLLMTPPLRNILGQVRSGFDARFIMDNRRIFIANLSKGRLGADTANLIGALLVNQFQFAALARADVSEKERRDFFLFIDEFQNFSTDTFASILSEARKYRLCLTLSHQYTEQLDDEVRQAIIGNVGSIFAFRTGEHNSRFLEREFGEGYPARRFTSLANYEVLAKLLEKGAYREPFLGNTLPPLGRYHGKRNNLIERSRQRYASDTRRWRRSRGSLCCERFHRSRPASSGSLGEASGRKAADGFVGDGFGDHYREEMITEWPTGRSFLFVRLRFIFYALA
jgi:hypothetical protein